MAHSHRQIVYMERLDMQRPAIVEAFEGATRAGIRGESEIDLWLRTLPDLIAPTGRIIACDPFYCADTPPFMVETPTGQYPVILSMAHFSSTGDERITAVMLRIADAPAVRWELAVCEEDTEQESPESYTFGVDSGFASFMDEAAINAIFDTIETTNAEGNDVYYEDAADYLQRRLESLRPAGGAEWFNMTLDERSGANALIFTSGWGDGSYRSYWGFDAQDQPVCLITDFGVLDDARLIE